MATVSRTPSARKPTRCTCRLTLTINGVAYRVTPIPITGSIATKLYRLRTADGTTFTVGSTIDGLSCHCDAAFRHAGADCEHVRAVVACGLFDQKGGAR